jgi:uncharacterized protein YegP (UPF0339 family)
MIHLRLVQAEALTCFGGKRFPVSKEDVMFLRSYCLAMVGMAALKLALAPAALQAQDSRLKFEVYQDASKEYRWRLKAGNGEVLATPGQGYKAKSDCIKGVERIKTESDKLNFEVYEDSSKEFRWRAKAANGQVVATSSQGYKAKADCEKAIELIKKGAGKAEVEEKT